MCRSCYRGHCYCSKQCRDEARRASLRRIRAAYQATEEGRDGHRERQNVYRHRPERNVTDHGSRDRGGRAIHAVRATSECSENDSQAVPGRPAAGVRVEMAQPSSTGRLARCCRCGCVGWVVWWVEPGRSVWLHGRRIDREQVSESDEGKPNATG
jgi:hypothetical protein